MTTRPAFGARLLDKIVAPNATTTEYVLSLAAAVAGAALATLHASLAGLTGWRLVMVAAIAFDIIGGAVITCTEAGKRHWNPPSKPKRAEFWFVASHVAHVAAVAGLFRGIDAPWFVATAGMLLASAGVIIAAPATLRRPTAVALLTVAVLLDSRLGATLGMEWFVPVFFLKLFVGYLVREAPALAEAPGEQPVPRGGERAA